MQLRFAKDQYMIQVFAETVRYLCRLLTRDLSAVERSHYGIDDVAPTCP